MTVAVIDYGSGNLRSVAKALQHVAETEILVTSEPDVVAGAARIVLPGVGAFADCMHGLQAIPGMVAAMTERVRTAGVPFLGICVGMQLLAEAGVEYGTHQGLGWIDGTVERLQPGEPHMRVPHMGWNALRLHGRQHPLLAGLGEGDYVYFANSYHFRAADPAMVLADVDYGGPVVAAIARDNIAATQFHPEKSQKLGLRVLKNFLGWQP